MLVSEYDNVHIRRISLAEFTGLEEFVNRKERLKKAQTSKDESKKKLLPSTSLIDTYSDRRRCNACISESLSNLNMNEILEQEPVQKSKQIVNFDDIYETIEKSQQHLEKTMTALPSQSPRKSFDSESERCDLLTESRKLAGACKTMVSMMNEDANNKNLLAIINEVIERSERVTHTTEKMIQKSNSIFQAQLITSNTNQMLGSLLNVMKSYEELQNNKSDDCMKRFTSRSTTLTATIMQLLSALRSV
ncbi:unnamed protein product [Thelazia callipaeda]|uniref:Uncharacterized protein n=1 Tax=Thelazia callipaeda TaxID=103827 RepID=A0A0N5DB49_THECL|nr:unnamed protein product [Thelazia callipaeda]